MTFRPATEQDKRSIYWIITSDPAEHINPLLIDRYFQEKKHIYLLVDKEPIGVLVISENFEVDPKGAFMNLLYIHKKYRDGNFGKLLLDKAVDIARRFKRHRLYLFTQIQNFRSILFYTQSRFYVRSLVSDRYGPGRHALLMCKSIIEKGGEEI